MILECLNQFSGILVDYKINVYSDHKKLVYAATQSEYQILIRWQLILEYPGPNIQRIAVFDNIVLLLLLLLDWPP